VARLLRSGLEVPLRIQQCLAIFLLLAIADHSKPSAKRFSTSG
jgi:hypothetical protein